MVHGITTYIYRRMDMDEILDDIIRRLERCEAALGIDDEEEGDTDEEFDIEFEEEVGPTKQ
jgi:hypothetical protein